MELSDVDQLPSLRTQLKALIVEELLLQMEAESISDTQPLFGPGGLGLDSVDALQLVVALEKRFGLKIPDAQAAREVLQSVSTMAEAIVAHQRSAKGVQTSRRIQ